MDADCRTRTYVSYQRSSRTNSGATVDSYLQKNAARIFEHRRWPGEKSKNETKGQDTNVTFPTSFEEIEQWLDRMVESEMGMAGAETDQSERVNLLFLDEKKCYEAFGGDYNLTKLHEHLKIRDWCTAHYMSTFCRFPLPIDLEDDDEDNDAPQKYDWDWRYTISHPFDWDMIWVYFPNTRTSLGVVRTWFKDYDADFIDLETMVTSFSGPTMSHPMLLGLFALQLLTTATMTNVREKGNRLFEAQRRTGFHKYDRLRSTDVAGEDEGCSDLAAITRDILGGASTLTGWVNASQQLVSFAKFIKAENERFLTSPVAPTGRVFGRLCKYIDQQSQKLIGDLDGAYCDCRAWLDTATFLLQGVLNLVSQRDAIVNIELARDSKKIAEESRRDSTSMTAIAVLTMFFLPSTFTASFFALPFFDSAIRDDGPTHFWIYWAVTLPLTAAVLVCWFIWTRYMTRWVHKRKMKLEEKP